MPTRPATSSRPRSSATTPRARGTFQIADYLRVLHRRRWTAGLAFLAVFVYGAFSTLKKTPIYEATVQLLIEKDTRRATSIDSVLEQTTSYYDEDFYQTQYRVLQSRALAARAVPELGLTPAAQVPVGDAPGLIERVRGWIGAPKKIPPPPPDENTALSGATSALLGGLTVAPVRNTHLVDLKYRSADPEFAARAANEIADQYIQQTLEARFAASKEAADYLTGQLEEQRKRVAESERALQDYQEQHNAVGVDDRQNVIVQRQANLNAELTKARVERIEKEQLYKQLSTLQGDWAALETFPPVMNNEFVQTLKKQLDQARQQKGQLAARYREGAPQMVQIDGQIQSIEAKIRLEIEKVVQSVKNDYLAAQGREQQFGQALASQTAEAVQLNRKGAEYAALKDEAASARRLYETLLQKANETGVSGEFKGTNIRVVDRAEVPRTPVLPNTKRDLIVAVLMGLGLAAGLAFGFEYLDSRIRTPDEIKEHLGLPFLGLVPAMPAADGMAPLLSDNAPPSFAEAVRAVRTAVVFSSAEEGARTVVVTSTAPGEGKTCVSSNLAVALAQAGQRTLVIDGDMRRPRIHEVFDCLQEPGLSNVLVGTTDLRVATCRTSVPNLFVLSAGHIPPNPAELLGSARFHEIIEELRGQFDWIIVDAPPVMAVTDAVVVANAAWGVVFVVGAEMTSRRHAAVAIEQLAAARAYFIGAVLNRADVQRHGYYYSTYYRKDYKQSYVQTH
ncbi:MAG: polysaccharide biosynthesis tyrosine autokinase [Acidobacteria bacterium]|nr:polysaccharide biosynthesis tyrosine autokinase [Acidobacteriota bacterium]